MNALVVGYGSIGVRHARILSALGHRTAVLSSREIDHRPCYRTLDEALRNWKPGYVVAANRTADRAGLLLELERKGFRGIVLAEKPVFYRTPRHAFERFKRFYVGYNLRFHPLIARLKRLLDSERVCSVQCYVGKYLPQWRLKADYRSSYSARRSAGGGVLRDLSHELDYLNWMLGPWKRLTALGGRFGDLKIDSDDVYALMIEFKKCPVVTVQMNYLDRVAKREIIIVTRKRSFRADLVRGTLTTQAGTEHFKTEPDLTYRLEHQAALGRKRSALCTYKEAMEVLRMIETAEKAARRKVWSR